MKHRVSGNDERVYLEILPEKTVYIGMKRTWQFWHEYVQDGFQALQI